MSTFCLHWLSTASTSTAPACSGRWHLYVKAVIHMAHREVFYRKKIIHMIEKNKLYIMSIFPSCTILHKEQECDAPFYDSRHPLKVFAQDIFPLGELVCEAKAKGTWELSLLEYLWFIPGLPMQLLNNQEVTQRVALLPSSFPALWKSFQVTNKLLPASLHCIFLFLTCLLMLSKCCSTKIPIYCDCQ